MGLRLAVRRLIESGECLPKELRPSREDISNGWTAPKLTDEEKLAHENLVMPNDVSAISVGLVDGEVYLDLDYVLDSNADVDMNVVGTSDGMLVEVQGTGEEATYSRKQFDSLMDMAEVGLERLHRMQVESLNGN
tara:strand:- start:72 stop:476 length:405 start_codon:yes stop_codon:yes gene_type:complete